MIFIYLFSDVLVKQLFLFFILAKKRDFITVRPCFAKRLSAKWENMFVGKIPLSFQCSVFSSFSWPVLLVSFLCNFPMK